MPIQEILFGASAQQSFDLFLVPKMSDKENSPGGINSLLGGQFGHLPAIAYHAGEKLGYVVCDAAC